MEPAHRELESADLTQEVVGGFSAAALLAEEFTARQRTE
jgi:hypothetical protein